MSGGADGTPRPARVPFEPEGSPRQVRYPVARGGGDLPVDAVMGSIRRARDEFGPDALTNLERWLLEASVFEAYFVHQGGFDYYFAHVDDPDRWADAAAAIAAMRADEAGIVFDEAVRLFAGFGHMEADQAAMTGYLGRMRDLNARFSDALPGLEARLTLLIEQFYPFSDRA
ncbi:hypothetical protein N0B44_20155 [Roseibacterium beibuensis]|uniref:hypothetical protein n=1 Tax=[Roseibacterium] beibuensis TaxID=1193142 RepID=UPI00217E7737|nr:hypothetical protein [Roseibacterium beibuensis]MCS6625227.1 hypothetical protein [Roseibacterium beibuensis]